MKTPYKCGFLVILLFFCLKVNGQEKEDANINLGFYDGFFISGYVDKGGFLNFTGPNINYTKIDSKIVIGMLPSLRFKEDKSEVKNAFITPNLGVGITYSYKNFAVQIPFYYNTKTGTENGKCNIGIGIGYRFIK